MMNYFYLNLSWLECKVFTSEVIHHLVIWSGELIRVLSKEVWKFSNMISEREEPGIVRIF